MIEFNQSLLYLWLLFQSNVYIYICKFIEENFLLVRVKVEKDPIFKGKFCDWLKIGKEQIVHLQRLQLIAN
jgi:hypothetical protein